MIVRKKLNAVRSMTHKFTIIVIFSGKFDFFFDPIKVFSSVSVNTRVVFLKSIFLLILYKEVRSPGRNLFQS